MANVAKRPVAIPPQVQVQLSGQRLQVKGPEGEMELQLAADIRCIQDGDALRFQMHSGDSKAIAGTMRSLAANMITGVTEGFEKRLVLQGVGYRVQLKGRSLGLQLGYSHPVVYDLPEGIKADIPSQTEIVIRGVDKQKVGQVASEIRAFRPPEPYKGKGVRYADERILRKEGKKK